MEDGHQQDLSHDDHHLPEVEVILELIGQEDKDTKAVVVRPVSLDQR